MCRKLTFSLVVATNMLPLSVLSTMDISAFEHWTASASQQYCCGARPLACKVRHMSFVHTQLAAKVTPPGAYGGSLNRRCTPTLHPIRATCCVTEGQYMVLFENLEL